MRKGGFICCVTVASLFWANAMNARATPVVPNPSDPNLRLWFRADAITGVSDGGSVTSWIDSSANANNLGLQTVGAPVYEAGQVGSAGGLPFVRFNGSVSMKTASNVGITGNITTTVFVVSQQNGTGQSTEFGWGQTGVSLGAFGIWGGLRGPALSAEYAGNNPAAFGAYSTSAFQIIELQKTPGAINTTTSLAVDGVSESVQPGSSTSTPNVSASPFYLGQWADFGSNLLNGNVAEVIVYNSALDAGQSTGVYDYLFAKYNAIPEPSTALLGTFGIIILGARSRRAKQLR